MAVYQDKEKAHGEWCSGTLILPGRESRRRSVVLRPSGKRLHGNMR